MKSGLNICLLREFLKEYVDNVSCEFGFPIGLQLEGHSDIPVIEMSSNNFGAEQFPETILDYLGTEHRLEAIVAHFKMNPFPHSQQISPLNTVPKKDGEKRVILDLRWRKGKAVNDFISKFEYVGLPVKLTFPSVDTFIALIKNKGRGCLMYKKDLS